jgi:hypothetical protein
MTVPQLPNDRWSLDFVADQFIDGRRLRILVVVDDCTRECLALIAYTSISGIRVARELDRLLGERILLPQRRIRSRSVQESRSLTLGPGNFTRTPHRYHSSLRWLGISDLIAEPEGAFLHLSYSYAPPCGTGVTRDTMPRADIEPLINLGATVPRFAETSTAL